MDSLTIMFLVGVIGLYLITFFVKKDKNVTELRLLTLLMGICSICTIITDTSLNQSEIGLLPIFPVIFIMLHVIINLAWRK